MSNSPQQTAAERAAAARAAAAAKAAANQNFMRQTVRKRMICPPASGAGLTQTYAVGAMLPFTVPSANNAYAEGVMVRVSLGLTLASGTSAVYGLTAGGPLQVFSQISILYNGVLHQFRPHVLKTLRRLRGRYFPSWPDTVLASGNTVSNTTSYINGGQSVSTGAQTWAFEFYIPFNWFGEWDCRGLLPTMGGSTEIQIQFTCASALVGADPILYPMYAVSGTGHAVTIGTATVQCIAYYRDGTSYRTPRLLPLDLRGVGVPLLQTDIPLNNITATNIQRQGVTTRGLLIDLILHAVDGNQSDKYSANSNIIAIQALKDAAGSNAFWQLGTGTNLDVREFFADIRFNIGQDLDEGVLPMIMGQTANTQDPNLQNGSNYLNTAPGGWGDYHWGLAFTSVSTTNMTPRVEQHGLQLNAAGLVFG
jgi:hypothetical protein